MQASIIRKAFKHGLPSLVLASALTAAGVHG